MTVGKSMEREPAQIRDVLLDIALQFGSTLELGPLIRLVLDRFADLVGAEHAIFALCGPGGEIERAVVHNAEWSGNLDELPVSHGLIDQVVESGQITSVRDLCVEDHMGAFESVQDLGIRLFVGVPIAAENRVIGVLYATSPEMRPHRAPEPDHSLLDALGRLVATAVQNARLFEDQAVRSRLLAEMAHDLRTPIALTMMNADFLGSRKLDPKTVKRTAEDISVGALNMKRIIDTTLEFSRIDAGAGLRDLLDVDLGLLLREKIKPFSLMASRLSLKVKVRVAPDVTPVETLPDRVRIVLDNMISNALKHATSGTIVTLSVARNAHSAPPSPWALAPRQQSYLFRNFVPLVAAADSGWVHICVHNVGQAIRDELRGELFEEYRSDGLGRREVGASSGLGLSIVAMCVDRLGGRVWVDSSAEGTVVGFSLPTSILRPADHSVP